MSLMIVTFQMIRPLNVVLSTICVLITAYLIDNWQPIQIILYVMIVVACFTAGGNILNDIIDIKTDIINRPNRPLPSGNISKSKAMVAMLICFTLGTYFVFLLPQIAQYLALGVVLPLLVIYTPILKRIPLLGNVAIASILSLVFIFSELGMGGTNQIMIIPAMLAFGLSLIRELVKDIHDIEGDINIGARTFPVIFGIKKSIYLVILFIIILNIFSIFPFINNIYGIPYIISLILTVEIPLFYCIFFLWKNPSSLACADVSKWMKLITTAGIGVILLSKF